MEDEQPVSDFALRSLAAGGAIAPRPLLGGYHIEVLDNQPRRESSALPGFVEFRDPTLRETGAGGTRVAARDQGRRLPRSMDGSAGLALMARHRWPVVPIAIHARSNFSMNFPEWPG
jgi:hypothetical protein